MVKRGLLVIGAFVLSGGAISSAAVLYTDDFNTNTSANYNTYITAGSTGPSSDVTFAYNYAAAPGSGGLAIPVAPHTTDATTLGLLQQRDEIQLEAGKELQRRFEEFDVQCVDVLIGKPDTQEARGNIETLLEQHRQRQLSVEQIETYQR